MKTVAIIQARMGSSRLPGKILLDIAGQPMLIRVVNRVSQADSIDQVLVATTDEPQDDLVAKFCTHTGIECFRGDHLDVLDRYYRAASASAADVVVRVTSDCPLIDPGVIDCVVNEFHARQPHVDYVSNVQSPRTFPRGLDVEVFSFAALERAWQESSERFFREHVTTYLYQHPERFRLHGVMHHSDESHRRWTVDTLEDLRLVREIYRVMGDKDFRWQDVLTTAAEHPEWQIINGHVSQKVA